MTQVMNAIQNPITDFDPSILGSLELISHKLFDKFKTMKDAFRHFDYDGNGSIDLDEFSYGLDQLGIKIVPEDIK